MNTPFTQPAAAAGGPVPAANAGAKAVRGYARALSIVEGIVYWGILAFGALFPFGGALYAWLR